MNQSRTLLPQPQAWSDSSPFNERMSLLGRMTIGVIHDLNNVLTIIQNYAETGLDNSDSQLRDNFASIANACKSSHGALHSMIHFARQESNPKTNIDINQMITDVHNILNMAKRGDIQFSLDLATDSMDMDGVEGDLFFVLLNLGQNALDAMSMGGILRIRTRRIGFSGILISFMDNGRGMSPETMKRATEPFYTTKMSGSGLGLGLARVDEIVKQHNGHILISSKQGIGTKIHLIFSNRNTAM